MIFAIFIIALVYASVGQAGASGFLAAMGLAGYAPHEAKLAALALNILVASIGTVQFWRAGQFSWRTFYPFGVLGFPFSLIGGAISLPSDLYYRVVGLILLLVALQLARGRPKPVRAADKPAEEPPFWPALMTGASIGLLSGITGTGGGIFLAPVILLMNWVEPRRAAAVSAAYNLINSAAAFAGAFAASRVLLPALPWWLMAAGLGGAIGATLGSRFLSDRVLRLILAAILALAGFKFLL
jgi:uncharacterized protein